MTDLNDEESELVNAIRQWAAERRASISADLASQVIQQRVQRTLFRQKLRYSALVASLFALIGFVWFGQHALFRDGAPVSWLQTWNGNQGVEGVVERNNRLQSNGDDVTEIEKSRHDLTNPLDEMARLRAGIESATEECRSMIAMEEASSKLYLAQRQSLIEVQAMQWYAANFPKEANSPTEER